MELLLGFEKAGKEISLVESFVHLLIASSEFVLLKLSARIKETVLSTHSKMVALLKIRRRTTACALPFCKWKKVKEGT